jgi:serine/threonine protein kinase
MDGPIPSPDSVTVEALAQCRLRQVFASPQPPPHPLGLEDVPADFSPAPESLGWASSVIATPVQHIPIHACAPADDAPIEEPGPDGFGKLLKPPQGPDELGRLGGYRVLRLLGQGGMGLIFEAQDLTLGRRVALKVIRPEQAETDQARLRFLKEARAVAAIDHDQIVTIYQAGVDNDVLYLAMQLLQGESLSDRLRREGRLPLPEVVRIARDVAEGLAAAHARGLIHRDIKPANIFLESVSGRSQSRVKVLDFGLAREVGGENVVLTKMGQVIGTPGYMAPEQARCEPLDARCDLFSLGCVIHHMASGERPFKGDSPLNVLVSLTQDAVPFLSDLRAEVPCGLAVLVQRLLAKAPDARPASARAVADELAAIGDRLTRDQAPPPPPKAAAKQGPAARPEPDRVLSMDANDFQLPPYRRDEPSAPQVPTEWRSVSDLLPPKPSPSIDDKPSVSVDECSGCGGRLRILGGKRWCLQCGHGVEIEPEPEVLEAKARSQKSKYWIALPVEICARIVQAIVPGWRPPS